MNASGGPNERQKQLTRGFSQKTKPLIDAKNRHTRFFGVTNLCGTEEYDQERV